MRLGLKKLRWWALAVVCAAGPAWAQAQPADAGSPARAPSNPRILIVPPASANPSPAPAPVPSSRRISILPPGASVPDGGTVLGPSAAPQGSGATTAWSPHASGEAPGSPPTAPSGPSSETLGYLPLAPPSIATAPPPGPRIDGHLRTGPFLSGPGSFTFLFHQTLMGAAGGFATQGIANDFHFDVGAREAVLAATLVGAGLGFGTGAWWQFHHWVSPRTAYFGIANSVIGGMFSAGLLNLTTDDPTALAWASVVGAEAGSWLTMGLSGGDLSLEKGLLIESGAAWGELYGAMLLAIIRFSGSGVSGRASSDLLMLAPGIGAATLAMLSPHFHPSIKQLLRADIVGAGVGGVVLLVSSLVLGHLDIPTPYVLAMLSSGTAMAIVSIFWDDGKSADSEHANSYRSVWW